MQSEQQQRIMGYFIEEAKDHLNTIEQGLLSLQNTMEDREMLNEIFRAAHSVKGGAAMLGINSIQQTAHRLEDCFKILQESSVKADHQLESLFLRVFDILQALVEQLQSPFGLTDEAASTIMSDAEPVFEELNTHLEKLVKKAEGSSVATVEAPKVTLANSHMNTGNIKTLPANFKRDVLIELREMLQLFKQQDLPEHRQALQGHCRNLARLGEQLDLPGWSELLESARCAIASPSNSYRLLANVVIKEIKQSQELVIAGRSVEICTSEQLKALVPEDSASESAIASDAQESDFDLNFDPDVQPEVQESETAQPNGHLQEDETESALTNLFESSDTDSTDGASPEASVQSDIEDFAPENIGESSSEQAFVVPEKPKARRIYRFAAPSEPEVGMAELNTLADIFEGQTPDLDETWQEEEIISFDDKPSASETGNFLSSDDHSDFSDLVGELDGLDLEPGASTSDDLIDMFGDESLEGVVLDAQEPTQSRASALDSETGSLTDDFSDLLFESDSPDPLLTSSSASDDLSSLFGDSFFEENIPLEQDLEDFEFNGQTSFQSQQQDDEFLAIPVADVFEEAPEAFSFTTDTSIEGEKALSENFTTQAPEFLDFEDSSQELENLSGDHSWLDSAPIAQSEMEFGDLLDISDSPAHQVPPEHGFSHEPVIDDQATDFGFEELTLDESAADFVFDSDADGFGSEDGNYTIKESSQADVFGIDADARSQPTDPSLDGSFFDSSTNGIPDRESLSDLALEDFMSTEEASATDDWNWDAESEIPQDDSATFNLGGDFTDTATAAQMPESTDWDSVPAGFTAEASSSLQDAATEESLWDLNEPELTLDHFELTAMESPSDEALALDFELDEISNTPFNLEPQTNGEMDNLFEESPSDKALALDFELEEISSSPFNLDSQTNGEMDNLFEESPSDEALALDFELDEISNTPFNLESQTNGEMDNLFEESPSDEASALDFELEEISNSSFNLEPQTNGEMDNWFEDEALPSSEASQSAALEELEAFEDLLELPTAETGDPGSEGLEFSALEDGEASSDFEGLNDFFNAEEAIAPTAPSHVDNTLDFEDFSIFDTPEATDSQGVASLPVSDFQEEAVEELLFDEPSASETEQMTDLSDALFDTDESDLFDLEATQAPFANTQNTALEASPVSDFEAMFGEETPGKNDGAAVGTPDLSDFDLSSFADDGELANAALAEDLNFDADLLDGNSSSLEWAFDAQPEATAEAQTPLFEWEETDSFAFEMQEVSAPEAAIESTALESPSASDFEGLSGDEIFGDTDSLDVSDSEAGARLRATENLFETEIAERQDQEPADEAAADLLDLDWDSVGSVEVENLDDFLSAETDQVTDDPNWDDLFDAASDSEASRVDSAALSEALDFEATDDETAAALDLDWGTQEDNLLFAEAPEEQAASSSQAFEFDDLETMLAEGSQPAVSSLETSESHIGSLDEFADLEAMLAEDTSTPTAASADLDMFEDLDALLEDEKPAADQPTPAPEKRTAAKTSTLADEFGDLESLLEQADKSMGGPPSVMPHQGRTGPLIRPRPTRVFEHTMRVPVKHLDSLSNLVGELVVNRNTLEQDQERLRQFLDNLSHQVLALSDVGARMQDLYERSLLESSLLASRQSYRPTLHSEGLSHQHHPSGVEYDPLEMDRFTGFHLLSQEMIELIVRVRESASDIEFLVDETDQVARMLRQITTQLQEGLTRARMVPFAQNADRLLRAVHEISRKLGKEAQLHVEGRETLIDKMILEHLYDPMTHLVNNALTHGIESPQVRKAAGKPAVGKVTLRAFHQGNQTVISISDDGAGIDAERVRSKAIQQRLITAAEAKTLTNVELYDCLFHPGFSTKDKADDFAGRGVGMDVVRTSLSEIRGTIHIDSSVGKGTTFTIRLPLTLSICKALCCLSDRARIAFPMDGVEDMMDILSDRVQTNAEGQSCIQWRDTLLPFHPLCELLTYKRQISRNTVYGGKREDDMISIVVLRSAGNFLAIQVDQVLGEQEIVIKQLEGPPPKPVGIAGATVLGDGRIMAIADVLELIDLANGRIRKDGGVTIWPREEPQIELPAEITEAKSEPMVLIVDDSITVRELLSMTFSKSGYRVEQARDGQEAWDKLRSGLPCDIVFCDIEMPRMDGLELLSRLQKDEKLCNLPIAMLTSRGADRHRQMAAQLGASGYFTKPYLEEVLLDAAQRMIRGEVLFNSSSNA